MRRRTAWILVLLLLSVPAARAQTTTGPSTETRPRNKAEEIAEKIEKQVEKLRGLEFKEPVKIGVYDGATLKASLLKHSEKELSDARLGPYQRGLKALALIPQDLDYKQILLKILNEQIAGFYDPDSKELRLIDRTTADPASPESKKAPNAMEEMARQMMKKMGIDEDSVIMAHELTHALQDQHYGIPTEPDPMLDGQGDRRLARQALFEGDATLAGFAYVRGATPDRDTISDIERRLHAVPRELASRYPDLPDLVRTSVAFQYDEGTSFAGWALADGGWDAVDRVQADPPDSTEQVLHPARYYATRERPVTIRLGGTTALEAAGWQPVVEDTLGELQVRILAARTLPADRASAVADGWAGDRLRALGRGDDLVLLWATAWDSPAEADEFAAALPEMVPDAVAERRGQRVMLVVPPSPGSPIAPSLLASAWPATRFAAP
jgi:hypothetical protein